MPRKKHDPLLSALIAKLPPSGSTWPPAERKAWVDMLQKAFDVVYGTGGNAAQPVPARAPQVPVAPPVSASHPADGYKFFIDSDGIAYRFVAGGDDVPVVPGDVTGPILDLRVVSDLNTVQWADGSIGINGHDLLVVQG